MQEGFLDRLKKAVFRKTANREVEISKQWFAAQLQNFVVYSQKRDPGTIFKEKKRSTESRAASTMDSPDSLIGQMVMYYYSPKHAKTLPFYDTFPLGIIVGPAKDGFYSMNLHYLPPALRATFLDNLLEVLTTDKIRNESRFDVTYSLLKNTSRYRYFQPCFKHYLAKHVRSDVKIITPEYWIRSVFLDTAQFKKATKQEVYRWSRGQI